MSALSFPSLTSDSSSLSRGSELDELSHERLIRTSLTPSPTASIPLLPRDPENSEVSQLCSRLSKLEQDKFVLGDYAAGLQSRIPRIESERMEHQNLINDSQELELPSAVVPSSLSRPNSSTNNTYSIPQNRPSLHRPSSSLSGATSITAKLVLARSSPLGTPSPSSSQLTPSKTKLVPKRSSRVAASDVASPQSEPSIRQRNCEYESMTPTRRRLQAMSGLFSSESSPSLGGGDPIQTGLNGHEPDSPHSARSVRDPYSKGITQDNARDQETKRPTFTSKLDSIILTSKLFPLSSSRSKTPLSPVSPDHHSSTRHTAVIPLVRATTSSTPHAGHIVLNSPPSGNVKVQLPRKGHNLLSQSLGLEENRHPHPNSKSADRKLSSRTRSRVSFSERLFPSPSDPGDETDMDAEQSGRMWGSWSRKRRPPLLAFIDEKPNSSPPSSPLSAFPLRISKDSDDRRGKLTSLAPGCLRSLVSGSGDRGKVAVDGLRDRHVPRRSHSESRRPHPVSRSNSGRSTTNSRPSEDGEHDTNMRGKGDRNRITPSRVGSPMPQSRLPELQGGNELERTNSMRSTGKWGHRGRQFSSELTRRRTIHPMFSFERPGSTEAASISSSRRRDGRDNDAKGDEHRDVADNSRRFSRGTTSPSPLPTRLPSHEPDVSQSQATHTQGYSEASGHSGGTGLSRPDAGLAGKTPMMRTRLGMQSHGTFAFEPAAAVVCSQRSTPAAGTEGDRSVKPTGGSLSRKKGITIVRSLTDAHARDQRPSKSEGQAVEKATTEQEYLEFCKELKAVLGGGEDWYSFKKYVRRFDLEVLSAEILVQRVKKLLDGRRTVDSATRLRLYERFVKAVHDNVNE